MANPFRTLAHQLVNIGYATEAKPITYGLTKQIIFEVFVEGCGWQCVDPFGNRQYSAAQHRALKIKNILSILLTYLDADHLLHFRKIHKPINEMTGEQIMNAVGLVERTLIGMNLNPTNIVADLLNSIDIDK